MNIKINVREPLRPYVPSVVADRAGDYFAPLAPEGPLPGRFILYAVPVWQADVLAGNTNADATGRLQVVDHEVHPRYRPLRLHFGEATGVSVFLNASFPLPISAGPIMKAPADTIRTFQAGGKDAPMLDRWIVTK